MSKQILFLALLGCMAAPVAAQTVDVTLQCGQSYTINSTVAATAGATYRWLENGSTVTGAAADYTVPATKSVGIYTYIRQAMSAGCTDWQNSNAFTVEVKNKNDDGVCLRGLMWATRNVDLPGTFAATADDAGKLYQFSRTTPIDHFDESNILPDHTYDGDWSLDSNVCPTNWRIPTNADYRRLWDVTPICNMSGRGYFEPRSGTCDTVGTVFWIGPDACLGPASLESLRLISTPAYSGPGDWWHAEAAYWTATRYSADTYLRVRAACITYECCASGTSVTWGSGAYRAYPIRCVMD